MFVAPTGRKRSRPRALLASTHDLGGGLRVRLRLARPSDAPMMRRFLDEEQVRRFTFYDPRNRIVLAASAQVGREQRLVGVAERDVAQEDAEPGVVVADEPQSDEIEALLTRALAA